MNPTFLELLSNCDPPPLDTSLRGSYVNTFAVNNLGDIVIISSDGRLKHSNIRSPHPDREGQLEEVELLGLLRDEAVEFTNLEYNTNNSDVLLWSSSGAGIMESTSRPNVHSDKTSFRFNRILDKLNDNGELNDYRIIKATFHPLSPYHVVVLFDNNTLHLIDYRTKDIQVVPLSKRFSSGTFTSFTFGPNLDWLRFTILLLTANGDVYTLCPIIPSGAVVPSSSVIELWEGMDQLFDSEYSGSVNEQNYVHCVQRYLTDVFGDRPLMYTSDDAEAMFVRAGESYERQHGDQLSTSNYSPQLVGPILIQRESNEQQLEGHEGIIAAELKSSEPSHHLHPTSRRPHGMANDICVPGNTSSEALPIVGAPVLAISHSTGEVDLLVFDTASQNTAILSWPYISPSWRSIDINRPGLASSLTAQTSLLLAETIRVCPVLAPDDDGSGNDKGFWSLLADPLLKHSIHVTNYRRGESFLISCSWLEKIQDDIANELNSDDNTSSIDFKVKMDVMSSISEGSPTTGDPILDHPSRCVPVFILPASGHQAASDHLKTVSSEFKQGTVNNSPCESLIGMSVLCDALLGHVVLFRCASGMASAINLTVHLRLSDLQESLSRTRHRSERLSIKEELSRAVGAEQIRWRHASECIRRVEEGLRDMPSFDAGTKYSLTTQSSSQNKKVLLEVAEKVERDVLIPINELAQSTAFSFQLLQESYKSQVEVLEGIGAPDASRDNEAVAHDSHDSLSLGLKNLIVALNTEHVLLSERVGRMRVTFDRQKATLEKLVSKAMLQRNKLTSTSSDSISQLKEWSSVIAKMNEQVCAMQAIAMSSSTLSSMNRTTAAGMQHHQPHRIGSALHSPGFSQSRSPATPLFGSKMSTTAMRIGGLNPPSSRTPPPLHSVTKAPFSTPIGGHFKGPGTTMTSPISMRSYTSSNRLGLATPSSAYTYDSRPTNFAHRAAASPMSNGQTVHAVVPSTPTTLQLSQEDQDICTQLLKSQTLLLEQAKEELAILSERLQVLKETHDY